MYIIVVYDIGVERITRVRQFLKQYLNWVQNSAFEGELTEGEYEKIKIGVKKLIEEKEDSILFYRASSKKWIKKEALGIEKIEVTTIL